MLLLTAAMMVHSMTNAAFNAGRLSKDIVSRRIAPMIDLSSRANERAFRATQQKTKREIDAAVLEDIKKGFKDLISDRFTAEMIANQFLYFPKMIDLETEALGRYFEQSKAIMVRGHAYRNNKSVEADYLCYKMRDISEPIETTKYLVYIFEKGAMVSSFVNVLPQIDGLAADFGVFGFKKEIRSIMKNEAIVWREFVGTFWGTKRLIKYDAPMGSFWDMIFKQTSIHWATLFYISVMKGKWFHGITAYEYAFGIIITAVFFYSLRIVRKYMMG